VAAPLISSVSLSQVEFTGQAVQATEFVERIVEKHGLEEKQKHTLLKHIARQGGLAARDASR
jgi:hypothetical protein